MQSLTRPSPLQKSANLAFIVFSATCFVAYTAYLVANRAFLLESNFDFLVRPVNILSLCFIAALLTARRPENAIGWLMLTAALLLQTNYLAAPLSVALLKGQEPSLGLLILGNLWPWLSGLIFTIMAYVFVLFPNGKLLSPRWRIATWILVIQILITLGRSLYLTYDLARALALARQGVGEIMLVPLAESGPASQMLHIRVIPGIGQVTIGIAFLALVVVLMGLTSLIIRFRRGNQMERQQIKWLIFALVLWGIAILLIIGNVGVPVIAFAFVVPMLAIAIGIAILRYRLYDIDIIINRTLVYGSLTVCLALAYFSSVLVLQQILQRVTRQQSPLSIVASTLFIIVLFSPLRRRIQVFIDRRFYRQKYDADKTLDEFAKKAKEAVDLDDLMAELLRTVKETVQVEEISLWLKKR